MNETSDSSFILVEIDEKNPEDKLEDDWNEDGDDEMNPERPSSSLASFLALTLREDRSKK